MTRKLDLLPVLQEIAQEGTETTSPVFADETLASAVDAGLGPYLAFLTVKAQSPVVQQGIQAANLTARLLTQEMVDSLLSVLEAAERIRCRPLLLKGMATAQRYYPAPYLRPMGDIDLCVLPTQREAIEAELTKLGFEQTSVTPAAFFDSHHHSMPFWHPQRQVWIEVHTGLYPPSSPLAHEAGLTLERLQPETEPFEIDGRPTEVMRHEFQLVYTCTRWVESFDTERGIFPMLDIMLLLRTHGSTLDWDRILHRARTPAIASALRLLLETLSGFALAPVPSTVLIRLRELDRHGNRATRAVLRRLVRVYILGRRPFGALATASNVGVVWSTLLAPRRPWHNAALVFYYLVFPPENPRRFQPSFWFARVRSLLRRVR